jgi:predicted GIY-YIG superfamily endonuclease
MFSPEILQAFEEYRNTPVKPKRLYILECQGYYKIGVSADVEKRVKQLQIGNPFLLNVHKIFSVTKPITVEKLLYSAMLNKKTTTEWFDLEPHDFKKVYRIIKRNEL